jgi:hypothetical protein
MPNPLQRINELIPYLPNKDIKHAKKFVENKDWESLKDLTWSSLQMMELAVEKGTFAAKYGNADLDKIRELALVCNEYYYLIYPEEIEIPDDYDDEGEEL